MLLKCIKGIYDEANVICLEGDLVSIKNVNEGEIIIEGFAGWCKGLELSFTPKQMVLHFIYWCEK